MSFEQLSESSATYDPAASDASGVEGVCERVAESVVPLESCVVRPAVSCSEKVTSAVDGIAKVFCESKQLYADETGVRCAGVWNGFMWPPTLPISSLFYTEVRDILWKVE